MASVGARNAKFAARRAYLACSGRSGVPTSGSEHRFWMILDDFLSIFDRISILFGLHTEVQRNNLRLTVKSAPERQVGDLEVDLR